MEAKNLLHIIEITASVVTVLLTGFTTTIAVKYRKRIVGAEKRRAKVLFSPKQESHSSSEADSSKTAVPVG